MFDQEARQLLESACCPCLASIREDDIGKFHCCRRFKSSILLYGRFRSYFPLQMMVGPDWPIVVLVYVLIIGINSIVLGVISPLGWPPVFIGIVGAFALLVSYSAVACTNPGNMVYWRMIY